MSLKNGILSEFWLNQHQNSSKIDGTDFAKKLFSIASVSFPYNMPSPP
ncbi:hypothetical protein [uncultured Flavobacterium sp.]